MKIKSILATLFLVLILMVSPLWLSAAQGMNPGAALDRHIAYQAAPLKVHINGRPVAAPADMDVIEGQVMIPLRWTAQQLGADSVQWDSATKTITIITDQDFYHIEKLTSYIRGLQPQVDGTVWWALPDRAKSLPISVTDPGEGQVFELTRPGEQIYVRIMSADGVYDHASFVRRSAINRQGHYYLPMDWLEYFFKAQVDYDQVSGVLSIQTPDLQQVKSDIALIEAALVPASPEEAVKLWGRGEQTRNGALQYVALSPQLRQLADKSSYVRETYWVTGFSSPWVGPITIEEKYKISDTQVEYTVSFPEITSAPPHTTAIEKLVVEKLPYNDNSQEGWFISQILQSSGYGIIDATNEQ